MNLQKPSHCHEPSHYHEQKMTTTGEQYEITEKRLKKKCANDCSQKQHERG